MNFVKEIYNKNAKKYSQDHEERHYWFELSKMTVAEYVNTNEVDIIVDIGCGSGILINYFASLNSQIKFIGIDYSEELIKMARINNTNKNVEFIEADFIKFGLEIFERLEIENKKVLLLVMGPFEYYEEQDLFSQTILKAWDRIIKGALIVTFHNQELFGRSIISKKSKKYWERSSALNFFRKDNCLFRVRYFSFIVFDIIASQVSLFDRALFYLDQMLSSKMPGVISKRIFSNFELLVYR